MKRFLMFFSILILGSGLLGGCSEEVVKEEVIRPVKAVRVAGRLEVLSGRTFPGKATATQEVNLSFRVAGKLNQFPARVGDEVDKGSLLANLDPRDFEVDLRNAQGQLKKAEAARVLAKADFERVTRIRDKDPGAISEAMIDQKKGALDSAIAQVQSYRAAVATARDRLSYTRLKAPFKGTVVETFVENFEEVQAKQNVIRLVDTRQIEFTVNVPENLIAEADKVKQAMVRFDAFPQHDIPATIKEIGKEASRTTRTYPVTLIMEQPEGVRVLPGMAGQAWADKVSADILPDAESGPPIPVAATFTEGGQTYVWIINEESMNVTKTTVEVGRATTDGVVITNGLKGGELVVSAGVHSLTEGQKVRLFEN